MLSLTLHTAARSNRQRGRHGQCVGEDCHLRGGIGRHLGGLLSRHRARLREHRDGRAGQSALAHLRQVDRSLPQLVAGPRRRHDRLHGPQHRHAGGHRARHRQPHQPEPPRLSVRHRRPRQDPLPAEHGNDGRSARRRPGAPAREASSPYLPSPERGFDFDLDRRRRPHRARPHPPPLPLPRARDGGSGSRAAAAAGSAPSSSAWSCWRPSASAASSCYAAR